jgi:hypothetical protein
MLVLDFGRLETQIDGEAVIHSSRGDPWDQKQRCLHLVYLEQNLMQQYEV